MHNTGVPNFDMILGGGVPDGNVLLIVGPPGTGKTTISFQMAFHTATAGHKVLYVSTLSEPPIKLMQHIRPYSFFDESLIGKRLFLLSIYPVVKQSLDKTAEALIQAVKEHQAKLLIVDGLMTVRDLYPEATQVRTFIYELGSTLPTLNTTTILTSSSGEELARRPLPEFTMADGVVVLGEESVDSQVTRTIKVSKLRGMAPLLGQHSLRLDSTGATVFPRIESVYKARDIGLSRARVPLGLPELDEMMLGGPPAGSMTVLAGTLGTGKTLTGLQFVIEGAQRGEKGLIVGFRESPRQLIDKARSFGLDLETPLRNGTLAIFYRPPVDLIVDEVTWELWQEVERFAPKRLVVDSISELDQAITSDRRRRGYMASMAGMLRARGITTLVTKEIPKMVGPELDFSDTPFAALAENLILLRYVELRGHLHRILSVLKMRDSDHDRSIREYAVTDEGIKVLATFESAEGVLTGIARQASKTPSKRRARQEERP